MALSADDLRSIKHRHRVSEKTLREIACERSLILACKQVRHGTESDLVRQFLESHGAGFYDERIPNQSATDTVVKEYAFRHGRADIVLFHTDGTATVIEAKDGQYGYTHVVAGIGQCSLYAAQLTAKFGVVRAVRRALMWTSVGDLDGDGMIEAACELAGVAPLPYPATDVMMATKMAAETVIARSAGAEHVCA